MSVTPELRHPTTQIYIRRQVIDPTFDDAAQRLRALIGAGNAIISTRSMGRAAVTLINQANMQHALRVAPRLQEYTAEELENELLGALPTTRYDPYRARLGDIALLEDPGAPLTLAVMLDEPDILDEQQAVLNRMSSLAGKPLFGNHPAPHISYAQFRRRPSARTLQKFEPHVPYDYQIDAVTSKPTETAV